MKIGILTYHAACNFGANLQALSTVSYLRERGYEPLFINWISPDLEQLYRDNTSIEQFEVHLKFRENHFPMTKRCITEDDIVKVIKEEGIEAIVIGSDAVMQTHPIRSRYIFPTRHIISKHTPSNDTICPNPFWGSFYSKLEKKIPICFMSASSQNSPYLKSNKREKTIAKELLSQFSYISTRDAWTSDMVYWLTDELVKPAITPDPVFAFNYNVKNQPTKEEILKKFGLSEDYCLFSFHKSSTVSKEWLFEIKEKMNDRGVQCVAFPFPQGINFEHPFKKQIDLPLSPLDWYALLKYSYAYIGENMHPIVVCLHNAVPCFSFDNYGIQKYHFFVNEKSSKIYHILHKFNLPKNRISILGRYQTPTVSDIIKQIDAFDKDMVKSIAIDWQDMYINMMSSIEQIITNSNI